MFKYTCLNPISQKGLEIFDDNYKVVEDMDGADAVMVRSYSMLEEELPESLKVIARAGAGVNNIPLEKCAEKGIVVFNTPGANANGVKELVIAAMLLASRDIVGGIEWVREEAENPDVKKLAEKKKKAFAGNEIAGKKLGIIGLGAIGARVANAAVDLGMEVYGYDPYISVDAAWNISFQAHHVTDVNEIYKECDFITIHVPALDSTKGMISAEAIGMMKKNAVVINLARDVLVDEEAIVKALAEEKIGGYVSDFPNTTTAGKPGVIVIPHLGASTEESEDNCAVMAAQELVEYLKTGNVKNSVNLPNVNLERMGEARLCVIHRNVPRMINRFLDLIGEQNINVEHMINKPQGDIAYTIIDTGAPISSSISDAIAAMDEVMRVRVIE